MKAKILEFIAYARHVCVDSQCKTKGVRTE